MLAAMPFDDEANAVHLTGTAYGTDYGLPAAVWTETPPVYSAWPRR